MSTSTAVTVAAYSTDVSAAYRLGPELPWWVLPTVAAAGLLVTGMVAGIAVLAVRGRRKRPPPLPPQSPGAGLH